MICIKCLRSLVSIGTRPALSVVLAAENNKKFNYIIYMSAAVESLADEKLDRIITENRDVYLQEWITGLMLYHNENFLGIIEGENEAIESFYKKEISRYPFCSNAHVLFRVKCERRSFSEWSMGFKRQSQDLPASAMPGYINLSDCGFSILDRMACVDATILKSIKGFCQCTGLTNGAGVANETLKPI